MEYERNFEAFSLTGNLIPLLFAAVVLWRFSPLLVGTLVGLMTLTFAAIEKLLKQNNSLALIFLTGYNAGSPCAVTRLLAFKFYFLCYNTAI